MEFLNNMIFQYVAVKTMAYLQREKETVEIDHSLSKVWTAISKVLTNLEWDVDQIDETAHEVKAKTKSTLMSWGSVLLIEAIAIDRDTTRVTVSAETPVTTITAMVEFGRTRQRIDMFFAELEKQLAN
jgi:hypothetical protein